MNVKHEFTIHAICPFIAGKIVWDYYTVTVRLSCVVDVHAIESVIAGACGLRLSQEDLCQLLAEKLSALDIARVELTGRHSANSGTTVICEVPHV
jgi:hypothetical protein